MSMGRVYRVGQAVKRKKSLFIKTFMPALLIALAIASFFHNPTAFGTISATVTTDKSDYGATEVVSITGNGFEADRSYSLEVISTDTPLLVYATDVLTDSLGGFVHQYQLDGIYRPNYTIYVKDNAVVVATTTFTDKPAANLDQCANLGTICDTTHSSQWQNGNLGQSQATYFEGDSVPYRAVLTGLTSGGDYTVTIEYDTTQSGKHAEDYLTSFDRTVTTADPCAGIAACAFSDNEAIPVDPNVSGAGVTQVPGQFSSYNANITAVSGYTLSGTYAGSSSTSIVVTLHATVNGTAVLAWGGHISTRADWGSANSAIAIPGSPYHMRLIDFTCSNVDNCGVGQQDRSLSAEAVIFPATITIIKEALPEDAQDFAFTTTGAGLSGFTLDDDSEPTLSNTKLFSNITAFGTKTITESAVAGWSLTGLTCTEDGTVNSSTSLPSRTATLVVEEGENLSCTFSNTLQQAHLTLLKTVTNDNGGTAVDTDWTLTATGPTPISGVEGNAAVTNAAVNAGSYTLGETGGPANYTAGTYSCVKNGQAPVVSNSISLAGGDTATCTINNNDNAPALHLRKTVTNDNGGTAAAAEWTLTATGTGGTPTNLSGSTPVDSGSNFKADTYALDEAGPANYTAGAWNCGGATMPDTTHVTVPFGGDVTCTINNDDNAAHLIVIKHVINDNGGTAVASNFTLDAGGANDSPDNFAGAEAPGVDVTLDAGSYNVTESGPPGYAASFSANCSGTIAIGQTKTCTVTNDDIAPQLIVIKHVINDDGGIAVASNFTLDSGGTNDSPDNFAGAEAPGTTVTLNAGAYNVTESGPSGYTASFSTDCSGTIAIGQTKTCTVTNDDQQAFITVVKVVNNDNGGTATPNDFNLTLEGSGVLSGVAVPVDPGTYTAGETLITGYAFEGFTGDCDSSGDVTVTLGQSKTCTLTNNDIQPRLTLIKHVTNDNGGTKAVADFPLFVNATGVSSGVTTGFNAGNYTASETTQTGYTPSVWSGDCAANGSVTLAVGDNKTCEITNNDDAPSLTLVKVVVNNNGGTAVESAWTLTATGPTGFSGVGPSVSNGVSFDAGSYNLSESGPTGYTASDWVCVGGTQNDGDTVTLGLGQSATCTITNDDQPAHLIVIKHVINDSGGTAVASSFTTTITGVSTATPSAPGAEAPGVNNTLTSIGAYGVDEGTHTGYTKTLSADCTGTIALGQTKTCTITNDDIAPQLTVIKHVINDSGDIAVASDFTMQVTGTNVSNPSFPGDEGGTTVTLNAGTYSVDEANSNGYIKTLGANCSGSIAVGEIRTCTITNNDTPHATRTQGFWQTHTTYTTGIFSALGGSLTIGTHVIDSPQKLFAGFYADISKTGTGAKRSQLDQARMQMLQQWLAAKLNCQAFGCSAATQTLLSNAAAAWAGTNRTLILSYANQLDAYNNSNDALPISGQGKATPKDSQALATVAILLGFWNVLP